MRIALILVSFLVVTSFSVTNRTSSNYIKIYLTGIEEIKGSIRIGIFDSENGFPVTGYQYKGYEYKVTGTKMTIVIHHIPKGKYAIGVMQDLNENDKLDKNFFGYPTEIYGFSNNARGTFSAPSFESASFYHDGSTVLSIKLY